MCHRRCLSGILAVVAAQAAMAAAPTTIELDGIVRDFKRAHPDFDVMPIGGPGHYAGNVSLTLGPSSVPVFGGSGFKVATQWQTASFDSIAPHMFISGSTAPGVVVVANAPVVLENATEDTWDSSAGPYSPGGPPPTYLVGGEMPEISAPSGLGPSEGTVTLGNVLVDTDRHFDSLTIGGTAVITGDRVIYCEGDFTLATLGNVYLMPDATLSLYTTGQIMLAQPHSKFNAPPDSGMPGRAVVYNLGTQDMFVGHPSGEVYATVIAPWATMRVMPGSDFFGNFIGQNLVVHPGGGLHIDNNTTFGTSVCGLMVADTAGSPGVTSDAAVTSATTFAQWYREILGVNMAASYPITLNLDADTGVYEYFDSSFYPIDGQLFGNEDDLHNNYFTYEIEAQFVYSACSDQFIEFMGSDDAWLFIEDGMVIDLGGIDALTDQRIDIDRLGLVDGEEHTMRLFFAHRHGVSQFNMRTNIEFWTDDVELTVSLQCD